MQCRESRREAKIKMLNLKIAIPQGIIAKFRGSLPFSQPNTIIPSTPCSKIIMNSLHDPLPQERSRTTCLCQGRDIDPLMLLKASSVLAEPKADDGLLVNIARPRLVPSDIRQRLLHHVLVISTKAEPLVPFPVARANQLEAPVLLRRRVGAAIALEQVFERRVRGDMRRVELEVGVAGQLPRGFVRPEDVNLGVGRWEEVVVAGLAAHAARRVCHLRGRHLRVDDGAWLRLSSEDVARAVGLVGEDLLGLEPTNTALHRDAVGRLGSKRVGGHHHAAEPSNVLGDCLLRDGAKVVAGTSEVRDVGLSLNRERPSSRGKGRASARGVSPRDGIPAASHGKEGDGDVRRRRVALGRELNKRAARYEPNGGGLGYTKLPSIPGQGLDESDPKPK